MQPGPILIHQCPNCNRIVKRDSLGSGNTFGADFFSDGFMNASMYEEYPRLVKCPYCCVLFWFDKSLEIGKIREWHGNSNEMELEHIARWSLQKFNIELRLSKKGMRIIPQEPRSIEEKENEKKEIIEQYLKLKELNDKSLYVQRVKFWEIHGFMQDRVFETNEEEIYLRLKIWRTFNNKFRDFITDFTNTNYYSYVNTEKIVSSKSNTYDFIDFYLINEVENSSDFKYSKTTIYDGEYIKLFYSDEEFIIWRDNLKRLLELLNFEVIGERILLAEIYRNFGMFNKSLEIINSINEQNYDNLKKDFIRECHKKNPFVFKLSEQ